MLTVTFSTFFYYQDGIPQIANPTFNPPKPLALQHSPKPPSFGSEPALHQLARGQPDLLALIEKEKKKDVVFTNVRRVLWRNATGLVEDIEMGRDKVVIVRDGKIVCAASDCLLRHTVEEIEVVDLKGGSVVPGKSSPTTLTPLSSFTTFLRLTRCPAGLVTFGSSLGLGDIVFEASTTNGESPDILSRQTSQLLRYVPDRAVDGYSAATLDALYVPHSSIHPPVLAIIPLLISADVCSFALLMYRIAARNGVSKAITSPSSAEGGRLIDGLSFAFTTSAAHPLVEDAILQEVTALHGLSLFLYLF